MRRGGNLCRGFLQSSQNTEFSAKPSRWQPVASFWLMSLIWRCLVLLSVGFNTVSARSPMDGWTVAGLHRAVARHARRHGNRGLTNSNASGALAASYSRYSSNLQSDESIEDQQRECRERADRDGHHLRAEFEFADRETSGAA